MQTDIRSLGESNSSDVDGWITQARQLQQDIEESKVIAREIVKNHEKGDTLSGRAQETKAKWEFLQSEISFNRAVSSSLGELESLDEALQVAETTLNTDNLIELAGNLKQLMVRTERLMESNAKQITRDRLLRLQDALVESLTAAAISMVEFSKTAGHQRVKVNRGNHGKSFPTP